jgi:thiol-disulfide isomerase/thioredoxin
MKNLLTKILAIVAISSITLMANPSSKPTFDLVDTNNQHIKITSIKNGLHVDGADGKVVFIEFFGYKCPPCLKTIPHFINLKNKYKDKLEIISIEVPMNLPAMYAPSIRGKELKQFADKKGINYHLISDENAGMFTNYIAQGTQWEGGIPFLLILDTKGKAQVAQVGLIPQNVLEQVIDKLLYNKPLPKVK